MDEASSGGYLLQFMICMQVQLHRSCMQITDKLCSDSFVWMVWMLWL